MIKHRTHPMNLLLIRHAETEWNRGGLIQGHQDSALTGAWLAGNHRVPDSTGARFPLG
ncbi:histidine phosphatase family protein [Cronobacter muytjensii]